MNTSERKEDSARKENVEEGIVHALLHCMQSPQLQAVGAELHVQLQKLLTCFTKQGETERLRMQVLVNAAGTRDMPSGTSCTLSERTLEGTAYHK